MKYKPFFRFLCTLVLWFYGTAAVQAGQVITQAEREWANETLAQEANMEAALSSKSIAVLNFNNLTNQTRLNALQKGIAIMLITDLSKVEGIQVIERSKTQAMAEAMGLGHAGLADETTALRLGKLLRAYNVVTGNISEGAIEQLELHASLVDVAFGNATELIPAPGSLDEMFRMEKDILFNILEEMNVYITQKQKRELEVPMSWSSAALFALFIGIDDSDKGMYKDAMDMYNRAVAEDPDLQLAKDLRQELADNGLTENVPVQVAEPEKTTLPPVKQKPGISTGTMVGVGLAAAAIAGGALLLSSSGSSDGGSSEPPAVDRPSASSDKTQISCTSDSIYFTFTMPMDTGANSFVTTSLSTFDISAQQWVDNETFLVSWTNSSAYCDDTVTNQGILSLDLTLNNFVSESGAALQQPISFGFNLGL